MSEPSSKVFKISQLPEMQKSDISYDDLVMVSDTSDSKTNAKYMSKKLTIGTLSAALQTGISDTIAEKTASQISSDVQQNVCTTVESKIDDTVQEKVVYSLDNVLDGLFGGGADFEES